VRQHLANLISGVVDYISYPLGMLLVAPIILHKLGASEYGLWMISTAIVSAGGIIASGFCDAATQHIARLRATGQCDSMADAVRSMMSINLVLGSTLAVAVWIAAPAAARHIAVSGLTSARECLISVRIAAVLIMVRGMESVGVSTHRAFEQYRRTVQISAAMRLLTLGSAAILALCGRRTPSILVATGTFLILGTCLQLHALRSSLGPVSLWPTSRPGQSKVLLRLGIFLWLQTVSSIVFGQCDRILLGLSLGALAVVPYSLCIQFAQPIFGLTASALHFLFPYLSGRATTLSRATLRNTVLKAILCNLLMVASGAAIMLLFGDRLIRIWAGPAVALSAQAILSPIVIGSAFLGLGVTGTYTMQALGLFKTVALISIGARSSMLLLMLYLLHHMGLRGVVWARLIYSLTALLVYVPLARALSVNRKRSSFVTSIATSGELQQEPQL